MSSSPEPRFAYEDPAALAWTAQMFKTARRRRLLRHAAEQAERVRNDCDGRDAPRSSTGGDGHDDT